MENNGISGILTGANNCVHAHLTAHSTWHWPYSLPPQAYTRPAESSARQCQPPVEICWISMPLSAAIRRGFFSSFLHCNYANNETQGLSSSVYKSLAVGEALAHECHSCTLRHLLMRDTIHRHSQGLRWGERECRCAGLGSRPVPVPEGCPGVPAPRQYLAVAVDGHGASAPTHLQGSSPLAHLNFQSPQAGHGMVTSRDALKEHRGATEQQ